MKTLILALSLFGASSAFAAAKNCTPYLKSMDGEQASQEYVYPCGGAYIVNHRGCVEGEIGYFPVNDSRYGGDTMQEEARVCHNGTFFPKKGGKVKHRGCTEGEIAYSNEFRGSNEFPQQVTLVCRHGRFVDYN